ncbi:MAG: serpin family protein [Deltaproteobacteria bacterium]|nr:serpin family protein [Deltaproteobacteria bacterium]
MQILVKDINALTFDVFNQLQSAPGNLIASPLSVSIALAMTYTGAQGVTEAQMADALHFTLPQTKLHAAMNTLERTLANRGDNSISDKSSFTLKLANSLWLDIRLQVLATFLDGLALNYGAGVQLLDFFEAEAAANSINRWVSDKTNVKIPTLLTPNDVEGTLMALVNTIYFKAHWKNLFDTKNTTELPFILNDGTEINVPMMQQTHIMGYAQGDGYQIVQLMYEGNEVAMILIVPDAPEVSDRTNDISHFTQLSNQINADFIDAAVSQLQSHQVNLTLPKWHASTYLKLRTVLEALGMHEAFTQQADFSGMTGSKDLYIDSVIHQADISVDEYGTEAVAATVVMMAPTSLPPDETVTLNINRPFFYVICDLDTGSILFIGRVSNPAE